MSPLVLLILRILHGSGVPIVVCGDQLLIGNDAHCVSQTPPPPPPPPPYYSVNPDPISISNGF